MKNDKVPFELGYSMPAEWERHEGTWLSWPKDPDSFPEEILPEVESSYVQMIGALHKNEKVHVLVDDEYYEKKASTLLESNNVGTENVIFHRIQTADVWFRDYGPIFVTRKDGTKKDVAFTHFKFNAWGDKYEDLKHDTKVPDMLPLEKFTKFEAPIVLEGGSIDMNGSGTCITTEQCLLNKNRNPHLSKEKIEGYIHDYLGPTDFIWLKEGIVGDDTDGHVDDLARFVNKDTIVCAVEENEKDENYGALMDNYNRFSEYKDQQGKKIKIVKLPMPSPVIFNNQRLPASYANFYIANGTVLVPTFNDDNDRKAVGRLKELFPERNVVGINCRSLVYGFGSIHCVTQQQPSQ